MRFASLLLALASCARGEPIRPVMPSPRWRLAQVAWSSVPRAGAAGDADLAAGAETLVFLRDDGPATVTKPSAPICRHALHVEVPKTQPHVGEPVVAIVRIDGEWTHEIAIERDAATAILGVEGAEPLTPHGRYVLRPGTPMRIRFTSAREGPASLAIRIEREIEGPTRDYEK